MATAKKSADSVKRRAASTAAPRPRKKKVSAPAEDEYKVTVHTEEQVSVAEPAGEAAVETLAELAAPIVPDFVPSFVPPSQEAAFFTPQTMSFELEETERAGVNPWMRAFLYLVGFVAVFALATAVILTIQVLHNSGAYTLQSPVASQPIPTSAAPAAVAATTTMYQLAAFNVPAPVDAALRAAITKDLPDVAVDSSAASFIPAAAIATLTQDTLLFKPSAQPAATAVLAELATLGLQPKLVANSNISDDFALYLTTVPANTDLSAYTATVVNASGVTGAAKKVCAQLAAYHVASCTAQNGAGNLAGGLQVRYKDVKAMVVLARTLNFGTASFVQVGESQQVEDVQVVIGK